MQSINPEDQSIILNTNDQIKIILHTGENTWLYLFLMDTNEDISLVFPERISFFDMFYEENSVYHIPKENWAIIDDYEGTDEFILIASNKRLHTLEKFVEVYAALLHSQESDTKKISQAQYNILVEIQNLKHNNSLFTREAKAEIAKIACKVRNGEDEEYPGIKITGDTFYTKTIRIEH